MIMAMIFLLSISGCNSSKLQDNSYVGNRPQSSMNSEMNQANESTSIESIATTESAPQIDLSKVKPNEAGRIMVVMFHNFVETYKSGDKDYTTTFKAFGELLDTLYESGYRLTSLNDYINNDIKTAAGYKPMVFTFDDGTAGQFSLVEENGILTADRQCAVGIMEEFNKTHPDFGLEGTFFVNLGDNTFAGKGTLSERLKYLIDKGFEIGNHTYTHINLKKTKDAATVQKEIGENQKKMYELVSGYKFNAFSLPYGLPTKELQQFVIKGEYDGVEYENHGIMEVGWDPALSPVNVKFNPLSIHRVRASGIVPVDADLAWWLKQEKKDSQYVSDGNPETITVPEAKAGTVDKGKLGGRKLVIY